MGLLASGASWHKVSFAHAQEAQVLLDLFRKFRSSGEQVLRIEIHHVFAQGVPRRLHLRTAYLFYDGYRLLVFHVELKHHVVELGTQIVELELEVAAPIDDLQCFVETGGHAENALGSLQKH